MEKVLSTSRAMVQTNEDVYTLARRRAHLLFDTFDRVMVSSSGGKDSLVAMEVTLEVARERGDTPLDVVFFDEEAIWPSTVEYMQRLDQVEDVRLHWYCIPVKERNGCCNESPDWYPWLESDQEIWTRERPAQAISTPPPGWQHGMTVTETSVLVFGPEYGTVANVMGIRADESVTRRQGICTRKSAPEAAFIKPRGEAGGRFKLPGHTSNAYLVYDWMVADVWLAIKKFGWDYNRGYDLLHKLGVAPTQQRCSPPYGEQPIRGLWQYGMVWPEMWERMAARVPGADTAARYGNTHLYGRAVSTMRLPNQFETWREYVLDFIEGCGPEVKVGAAKTFRAVLTAHAKFTDDALPDDDPHHLSGYSWRGFDVLVQAGGNKLNRQLQKIQAKAIIDREKVRNGRSK